MRGGGGSILMNHSGVHLLTDVMSYVGTNYPREGYNINSFCKFYFSFHCSNMKPRGIAHKFIDSNDDNF